MEVHRLSLNKVERPSLEGLKKRLKEKSITRLDIVTEDEQFVFVDFIMSNDEVKPKFEPKQLPVQIVETSDCEEFETRIENQKLIIEKQREKINSLEDVVRNQSMGAELTMILEKMDRPSRYKTRCVLLGITQSDLVEGEDFSAGIVSAVFHGKKTQAYQRKIVDNNLRKLEVEKFGRCLYTE